MAVSDYSTTAGSNTSISGINIAEGCSPANLNNAIRQLMADVKGLYNTTANGLTASIAELNILDGVTATAAELNILDGVTSTAAELNILDGATLTVTELNYVDGVTSAIQTQLDGKVATIADPGADRIRFWDDSAGAEAYLTVGTGLQITDTTLAATGTGWADVETLTMTGTTVEMVGEFEEGYDYRFILRGVSPASSCQFRIAFYGETAAAYSTATDFTDTLAASNFEFGEYLLRNPRKADGVHSFTGESYRTSASSASDQVVNLAAGRRGAVANYATPQGLLRVRFSCSTGDYDAGTILVQRKQ